MLVFKTQPLPSKRLIGKLPFSNLIAELDIKLLQDPLTKKK
jgi:hypothetical protein